MRAKMMLNEELLREILVNIQQNHIFIEVNQSRIDQISKDEAVVLFYRLFLFM